MTVAIIGQATATTTIIKYNMESKLQQTAMTQSKKSDDRKHVADLVQCDSALVLALSDRVKM